MEYIYKKVDILIKKQCSKTLHVADLPSTIKVDQSMRKLKTKSHHNYKSPSTLVMLQYSFLQCNSALINCRSGRGIVQTNQYQFCIHNCIIIDPPRKT